MRRFFPALLLLCLFTACQKEVTDTLSPSKKAGKGSFTATIDGKAFVADKHVYAGFAEATMGVPPMIHIFGLSSDKKLVGMVLLDSGVRQYTLDDVSLQAGVFQDSSLPDVNTFSSFGNPNQPSGKVHITRIDKVNKTISGTFSFEAFRFTDNTSRKITNGVFKDVPYGNALDQPAAAAKDTFRAKVDGVAFATHSITGMSVSVNNSIMLQGGTQDGKKFVSLSVPANIVPGSYNLDIFGGTHIGMYLNGTTSLSSSSGTVQVLEHNRTTRRIRGNFNFTAEPIIGTAKAQISDGYFSLIYK